jgi:hypothetical protein
MHWSIVLITTSLPSVFHQLVDACNLTSKLLIEVICLSILEDYLGIKELLVYKTWCEIASTHNENLGRSET